jgi:hypothetical protein
MFGMSLALPDCLARAERMFAAPRFIHLTRHPRPCIDSFVRLRFHKLGGPLPVRAASPWHLAEKVWDAANTNVLQFLEQVDPRRQHRIAFEDLVTDTERCIRGVCDSLGVPFRAATLTPYSGERTTGMGKYRVTAGDPNLMSHEGVDPSLATAWQSSAVRDMPLSSFTEGLAERLGYSV